MLATLPVGLSFIPDRSQVLGSNAGHAALTGPRCWEAMLATLPVGLSFIPDRSQVLGSDADHAASGTELYT